MNHIKIVMNLLNYRTRFNHNCNIMIKSKIMQFQKIQINNPNTNFN